MALVERGEGMSTAKAEDFLSYIKTFKDLRAQVLPKKIKTCWKIINKVGLYMLFLRTTTITSYTPGRSTTLLYIKKTEGLELGAVDKLLVGIFAGRDEGGEDFPNSPRPPLFFSPCYPITIFMILLDQ